MALKNKYKKEKKELEDKIAELEKTMAEISGNNRSLGIYIDRISEEYDSYLKKHEDDMHGYFIKEREY